MSGAAGPPADWRAELRGAANATAALLPFVLVYGVIVFGAFGAGAALAGLGASVLAVALGGALLPLISRATLPAASPSASSCLILGATVTAWARDPALAGAAALPGLLALVGLTVAATGAVQLLLGLARAGSLVGYVPRPVLSGFMNGVALLIVGSQVPALLGVAPEDYARRGLAALQGWQPVSLGLAAATTLLAFVLRWRFPRAPAVLIALVTACAAVAALRQAWPVLAPGIAWPVPSLGGMALAAPDGLLTSGLGVPALQALWRSHGREVLATALLLGLIGSLESVLNLASVDQQQRTRSGPNRLLVSVGLVNLVLGSLGGLPVVYQRLRALATAAVGARRRRSLLVGSALLALVFAFVGPLGPWIPRPVVAGVLVVLAWTLVDAWSLQLARRGRDGEGAADRATSLGVMAAVCGVTVVWGFAPGVALGVLLSLMLLVRSLNRSLVRSRFSGAELPSRRLHPAPHQALLAPQRAGIDIVELEGALFFGNVERLRRELEARPAGLPPRWAVVLDLRRVSTIDASAAVALAALRDQLVLAGSALLLAGVAPDNRHGRVLLAYDAGGDRERWSMHGDADQAVEAAERMALARAGATGEGLELPLRETSLFRGLDDAAAARLAALMTPLELQRGQRLFGEGEHGDALYVLTRGSITVLDEARGQRFVSFSAGHMFGEAAVLDGRGRTATAVADVPSTVCRLAAEALARLRDDDAPLAAQVYLNIARHLAERLRDASVGWRRVDG